MKLKLMEMLLSIFNAFGVVAHAERTTITDTGEEGDVKLDNAVRQVYSNEIEYKAMGRMVFQQFAQLKTELGVQPGLTIAMITYDNLKGGGALEEGKHMTTENLSNSMKEIRVGERGHAVAVSRLAVETSFHDIMGHATDLLARNMAEVLDIELRDTALETTNVVYGRQLDEEMPADRTGLTKTSKLTMATIKDALEILATNNAPTFADNSYVCFVHPHQSRDLRDDGAWINASNYGDPQRIFRGEIGRIDNVRFIETTYMPNGAAPEDSPSFKEELKKGAEDGNAEFDVYQALLFGPSFYGLAVALPVELRDNGVIDFGRTQEFGWYGIWGSGILHNDYGVRIETV